MNSKSMGSGPAHTCWHNVQYWWHSLNIITSLLQYDWVVLKLNYNHKTQGSKMYTVILSHYPADKRSAISSCLRCWIIVIQGPSVCIHPVLTTTKILHVFQPSNFFWGECYKKRYTVQLSYCDIITSKSNEILSDSAL